MNTLPPEPDPAPPTPPSASQRVIAAFERISEVDRPELWTTLRAIEDVLVDAKAVDERVKAGENLPLAGTVVAVKDVIDVAGQPTTAGCPSFARVPETSATVVARLTAAGAVVLGKTNLDQFGYGLTGTRSPYGAVTSAWDRTKVAGGASCGSAVAVALGVVDLALGTDTAGSGRIPAALNAVVGLKPTLGLLPMTGVLPTSRSYDSVSVFATGLAAGRHALALMTGPDGVDPGTRPWPADVRLGAGDHPRIAIPDKAGLAPLSAAARLAFEDTVTRLAVTGAIIEPIAFDAFREAGELVYTGSLDAESYAVIGEFLGKDPADADPTVATLIHAAGGHTAHAFAADKHRLAELKVRAARALDGFDALLVPTVPDHPDLAEALADPIGVSHRLATYSSFVNVLDLAAVTVPVLPGDRRPFGVTFVTRAFEDQIALDLATVCTDEPMTHYPEPGEDLVVFGAHLRGQPLNSRLTELGARFTGPVRTAERYRMVLLATEPPQPGVLDDVDGSGLDGERWRLSPAALGRFAATLPEPFVLARVELEDGSRVLAVRCEKDATTAAPGLERYESWRGYVRFTSTAGPRGHG
ncbi:allophanate hydrolase [Amycolatopsis sp. WQ 127309]|uniref:allophanate hydrolase n=1 Tax=Amycolatopsis sp. WQ 127309 TaxID=2932773 RepID=UPI001FF0E0D8|nr:allophanate hydrolase [Amycolatopsis sp. WQ 127309]UOZ06219.1 allophanate hydrolase [Amycolatopsis sp. WQ 127309]